MLNSSKCRRHGPSLCAYERHSAPDNSWVSYNVTKVTGGGGSTLKQNTVIRVSRLFVLCISLVFGGKYMEFRIIFSLQYSINVNHGGHKRQLIRPRTNNFLSLVWNITKLPHRIELAIPKNLIVFVFRFCYILTGK